MWGQMLGLAIAYAPQLVAGILAEFEKTKPTPQDYRAMFQEGITVAETFIAKEKAALAALGK